MTTKNTAAQAAAKKVYHVERAKVWMQIGQNIAGRLLKTRADMHTETNPERLTILRRIEQDDLKRFKAANEWIKKHHEKTGETHISIARAA